MDNSWKWNSSHSTNPLHGIWNLPQSFLQQETCNFFMQKEIVLLTSHSHKSIWEKVHIPSNFPIFKQNRKTLGLPPRVTFGLPQPFNLTILSFCECSWFRQIRYISLKVNSTFIMRDQLDQWSTFLWASAAIESTGPVFILLLYASASSFLLPPFRFGF